MEALGKAIFFDASLSANGTQSCATCHAPEVGFTGPDSDVNASGAVYQGALPNHFGNRKPPASAYAGDTFPLELTEDGWFGGMFWDGRATGDNLGDPLAEQAQGPFLNPLEQALPNAQVLCQKVKKASYAGLYETVWGKIDCAREVNLVYENIARSVAAYERSEEVSPFTSKFDQFWDNAQEAKKDVTRIKCGSGGMGGGGMGGGMMAMGCPGGPLSKDSTTWANYRNLGLTDQELQGLAVFNDPNRGNCASCHSLDTGEAGYPLFTDYGYDNIGVPKNPENPFYSMPDAWNPDGPNWVDYGLGAYLKSAGYPAETYEPEMGKFKVPTLRNVDLRPTGTIKAYGHNGYFKSLEDIVFFYHWRAMMDNGGCSGMGGGMMGGGMGCDGMETMFPAPEVDQNRAELGMFPRPQVDNIVAFLKTLSDGYFNK
jgi:cytochrome c peroxidase